MKWNKMVLHKDEMPVKVYVNQDDSYCVVFPLFGKYYGVHSDASALDLCIQIMFHVSSDFSSSTNVLTFGQYLSSQEDTAIIYQQAA